MEVCQQNMIIPLFYGAMPNMGLYYTPDGPFENPGDLMKAFKIQEARLHGTCSRAPYKDTVWVMQKLFASGADGVNFDTTAAAGVLTCTAPSMQSALRKEFPDMYIETAWLANAYWYAGNLQYDGVTLAGLWPHQQAPLIAKQVQTFSGLCATPTQARPLHGTLHALSTL